ncbi:hypothetical protein HPB50_016547 [Hyalomma asiaticum]|uniref:Uncharacterized protein n=1 Tax=Hyalomma asiaticum TaxID=266040 RepID=A0ACB7SZE5_HYAAI|nr:hypothetical protein HPB50_016547 [Hyalomma asiaticum]
MVAAAFDAARAVRPGSAHKTLRSFALFLSSQWLLLSALLSLLFVAFFAVVVVGVACARARRGHSAHQSSERAPDPLLAARARSLFCTVGAAFAASLADTQTLSGRHLSGLLFFRPCTRSVLPTEKALLLFLRSSRLLHPSEERLLPDVQDMRYRLAAATKRHFRLVSP